MIENIPPGWEKVKLGKYVVSQKGKKPKTTSKAPSADCPIPYINIKAFEKNIIEEYTDGQGCVLCEDGDFLMVWDGSRSGYVGKAIKGALGSTLVKLKFPDMHNNYAYYFLQSKYREINSRAKGVGIPHVDPYLLWDYDLLIPPIITQQSIVNKIEELFSELDKGIENLKIAQEQLKVYRQSVLKWAFEGKLTNDNGIDDKLPEGWNWVKLGEVSQSCLGKMLDKQKNIGTLKPYLRNINVRWNNFKLDDLFEMPFKESENERFGIEIGDLIICEGGEPGRAAIWKGQIPNMKIQKALHRVRFNKSVCTEFFLYYLNLISTNSQINKYFTGTTIKHLTGQSLKKISFPLPSVKEQQIVIQEIESRLSIADKMEEIITQSLLKSETLRQSILKKAFAGKLL